GPRQHPDTGETPRRHTGGAPGAAGGPTTPPPPSFPKNQKKKTPPPLLKPKSRGGLAEKVADNLPFRPPVSANSLPRKPRNGPRWSAQPTSGFSEAIRQAIPCTLRKAFMSTLAAAIWR